MYALDQTLSQYEARRAAGVQLSASAPLLSVDEGLVPLHTADDLVRQYNCGDLNSTLFASVEDQPSVSSSGGAGSPPDVAITRQINDYFRNELIDKRNRRMAVRIDHLLTDRPELSFFFAFGAGISHSGSSGGSGICSLGGRGSRITGVAIFSAEGHRTILSQQRIQDLVRGGFVRGSIWERPQKLKRFR